MVVESLLLTALMSIVCNMELKKNSPALLLQSRMVSVSASIAISLRRALLVKSGARGRPGLSMLFHSAVPDSFIRLLLFVINNQPTLLLNHRSPYEILHGAPPAYSSLRAFGCLCYVHISKSIRHKLEPKADCCSPITAI